MAAPGLPNPEHQHVGRGAFRDVYAPAEDTFLLLDALEAAAAELTRVELCLEVGSGSGVVSTFLASMIGPQALYLCTDINPNAAACTLETARCNQVHVQPIITDLVKGLLPRLKEKVDLLVFNPPYVVTPPEEVCLPGLPIALCAVAAITASSIVAKIMSTVSLATAGGAASGSVLTGLSYLAAAGGAASGSVLTGLSSLGLTVSSKAALGSMLGTLQASSLLASPVAAVTTSPLAVKAVVAAIGGAATVGAVPVVLGTMGFTGAGITASSLAAKMMSVSAIANGGGVAAGGMVATLQSVGAAGLSLSSKVVLGSVGALVSLVV